MSDSWAYVQWDGSGPIPGCDQIVAGIFTDVLDNPMNSFVLAHYPDGGPDCPAFSTLPPPDQAILLMVTDDGSGQEPIAIVSGGAQSTDYQAAVALPQMAGKQTTNQATVAAATGMASPDTYAQQVGLSDQDAAILSDIAGRFTTT